MLVRFTDDARSIALTADTLGGALRGLVELHPALRIHLFDERGDLRQHVLCLHNQKNSRWFDSIERPVHEGDTITILQAVSGG